MGATVRNVRRTAGAGGDVRYDVDVEAPDGAVQHFEFSGNMFVGPVVLVIRSPAGHSSATVIGEPRRFGEFAAAEWVHRFVGDWQQQLGHQTDCLAQQPPVPAPRATVRHR
jgi:hypothetical protein